MIDHPDTYTLSREDWLVLNRALSGAALNLTGNKKSLQEKAENLLRLRKAQLVLSESYQRARLLQDF